VYASFPWIGYTNANTISGDSSDNAEVRCRLLHLASTAIVVLTLLLTDIQSAGALSPAKALTEALGGTQASGVVLDLKTGALLASAGPDRRGIPGSVLKPWWLAYALGHGIVRPETEVYCRRNLRVGDRALPCTHPADQAVFSAETALSESCNTWFADLGRRYTGAQLEAAMQSARLPHVPLREATTEQRELAVLGLYGTSVSPLELARTYRELLQHTPPEDPVIQGLRGSVRYGMGNPADVPGLNILGKTGTASNPGEAWTQGWFAGALPGRLVVVVYVPHGDGGTAARLAKVFFLAATTEGKTH
jgi:cell division protein FtsI/penicillin-binding protein 2